MIWRQTSGHLDPPLLGMSAALLRLVGVMCAAVVAGRAELLREDATGTPARGGVIVGVGILSRSDHAAQRRCGAISLDEQTNAVHRRKHTRARTGGSRCIVPQICTHAHTHTHRCFTNLHAHTHTAARSLSQAPSPLLFPSPPSLETREGEEGRTKVYLDRRHTHGLREKLETDARARAPTPSVGRAGDTRVCLPWSAVCFAIRGFSCLPCAQGVCCRDSSLPSR